MLGILLLLTVLLNQFAGLIDFKKPVDPAAFRRFLEMTAMETGNQAGAGEGLFMFDPNTISPEELDSLAIPAAIKRNLVRYRAKGGSFRVPRDFGKLYGMNDSLLALVLPYISIPPTGGREKPEIKQEFQREIFSFNPNTVSGEELERLGFTAYQRRNLLNYRDKGGKFRRREELLKVYGIDSPFYLLIAGQIDLGDFSGPDDGGGPLPSVEKTHPQIIELNKADSLALTSLPGIGPAFAKRIISYRRLLGGFHSPQQLLEVYGMTPERLEQFSRYVTADSTLVKPLRVNFADARTLAGHPYLTGEQANRIVGFRSANGPFNHTGQLVEGELLDVVTFGKIRPYLTCR